MPLPMTRPYAHPKTGVYWLRKVVPEWLRGALGKRELVQTLGTKDPGEARARAPAVIAEFQAIMDRARRKLEGGPDQPSARQIAALAGEWYRQRTAAARDEAGQDLTLEVERELFKDAAADVDAIFPPELNEQIATGLLKRHGFSTDPDSVRRLSALLVRAEVALLGLLKRRAEGDWSPDPFLPTLPELPRHSAAAAVGPSSAFNDLLTGWAKDRGFDLTRKPIARAAYDRKRTMERLGQFLGHRDAARVSRDDVVSWKEAMQEKGLTAATIRNDLSEMSAIWSWGMRNGKATVNPFAGVAPPKERGRRRQRRAFTETEAALILSAARDNQGFMRWLPWVCCLTGARISEICQAAKSDIAVIDRIHVLRITDEGDVDQDGPRSLKNDDSRRNVPLHPALIAEGFLEYVHALPAGSALFPDAMPDKVFGLRSTTASRRISRWLRSDLNITDERISPNHSWRHYFIEACRRVAMHPEIRSALTGHSAKMDESAAYGDGMKAFTQVLAENIAKLAVPVPPLTGRTQQTVALPSHRRRREAPPPPDPPPPPNPPASAA